MKIIARRFDLQMLPEHKALVVGFTVQDDDDSKFFCIITQDGVDPTGSYCVADGKAMEKLFDAKVEIILEASKKVIADARARGVQHVFGQENQPLKVHL